MDSKVTYPQIHLSKKTAMYLRLYLICNDRLTFGVSNPTRYGAKMPASDPVTLVNADIGPT